MYYYLEQLQRFGYRPSEQATAIAGKARFSQHAISPEERELLQKEATRARQRTLFHQPYYKKLLFYLRGL